MTLVLDASVVVQTCAAAGDFGRFHDELLAPPFMWAEARSALHLAVRKGQLDPDEGLRSLLELERAPVRSRSPARMGREVWRIADQLGWGRTFDAEYLALARLLGGRFVTIDQRLYRATRHLGFVVGLHEL